MTLAVSEKQGSDEAIRVVIAGITFTDFTVAGARREWLGESTSLSRELEGNSLASRCCLFLCSFRLDAMALTT